MEIPSSILPESVVVDREIDKIRVKIDGFVSGNSPQSVLFELDAVSVNPNAPLRLKIGKRSVDRDRFIEKIETLLEPTVLDKPSITRQEIVPDERLSTLPHTPNIGDYLYTYPSGHPTISERPKPKPPEKGVRRKVWHPDLEVFKTVHPFRETREGEDCALIKEAYSGFKVNSFTLAVEPVVLTERWILQRSFPPADTERRRHVIRPRSIAARGYIK